ncbi:SapC family protein [Halomonas sp.]|uniref:SapC family protein n=1 Tax=Halomonas sp. TaxID=1486246 RepID=UPI0035621239
MLITPHLHRQQRCLQMDNRTIAARQPVIDLVAADIAPLAPVLPIVIPVNYGYGPALPQALVDPDSTHDPFKGHTPQLWQDYPFQLVAQSLAVDADGQPVSVDALWADPKASCWSQTEGYYLFDNEGEPSSYLRDVMKRLREVQEAIEYTRQLVELLRRCDALLPGKITHHYLDMPVYRVSTKRLGDRLDALDTHHAGLAMTLAERLEASQEGLVFSDPDSR